MLREYFTLKESIENRIEEIELFYESNFDEPHVLNFQKGVIQLKNILIQNKPNCSDYLERYKNSINNTPEKNLYKSNFNIKNKNATTNLDKNINKNIKKLNESKIINNSSYNNNTTNLNNSGSILNNNIFNNKLLFSFQQKENDLKYYEAYKEQQKNKKENITNNEIEQKSNILDNENDNKEKEKEKKEEGEEEKEDEGKEKKEEEEGEEEEEEKEEEKNEDREEKEGEEKEEKEEEEKEEKNEDNNHKLKIDYQNRNEYGKLFNLQNMTSDNIINTIKSDNDLALWKENESNIYEQENSINEELREKFRLKEVLIKFILNDEEYSLLIQERAKNINPFND